MPIILSDDTGYNGRLQGRAWRVLCVWSHVLPQRCEQPQGHCLVLLSRCRGTGGSKHVSCSASRLSRASHWAPFSPRRSASSTTTRSIARERTSPRRTARSIDSWRRAVRAQAGSCASSASFRPSGRLARFPRMDWPGRPSISPRLSAGRLPPHFCVVTDPRGRWLGQTGAPRDRASRSAISSVIDHARSGRSSKGIVALADGPAIVVTEPSRSGPDVTATVTAGYRLDDALADEVAKVTRGDVAFVCPDDVVCGSNMPVAGRAALTALFENNAAVVDQADAPPRHWRLAGTPFVADVHRLAADQPGGTVSADKSAGQRASRSRRGAGPARAARELVGGRARGEPDPDGARVGRCLGRRRGDRRHDPAQPAAHAAASRPRECGSRNRRRQLGPPRPCRRPGRSAHDGRGVQPHDRDAQPLARGSDQPGCPAAGVERTVPIGDRLSARRDYFGQQPRGNRVLEPPSAGRLRLRRGRSRGHAVHAADFPERPHAPRGSNRAPLDE